MDVAQVRNKAVDRMCNIIQFHLYVILFLFLLFTIASKNPFCDLPCQLCLFYNITVLAERIWHVQAETLIYWSPITRYIFIISRVLSITLTIATSVFVLRVMSRLN